MHNSQINTIEEERQVDTQGKPFEGQVPRENANPNLTLELFFSNQTSQPCSGNEVVQRLRDSVELHKQRQQQQQQQPTITSSNVGRFQITELKHMEKINLPSYTSSSGLSKSPTPASSTSGVASSVVTNAMATKRASISTNTPGSIPNTPSPSDNVLIGGFQNHTGTSSQSTSSVLDLKYLANQLKILTEISQKQMKLLNALYMLSNAGISSVSASKSQQQTDLGVLALLEQLQRQVNQLMDENKRIKEENIQLRVEVERYRKSMASANQTQSSTSNKEANL
jgi:hypothetical protein